MKNEEEKRPNKLTTSCKVCCQHEGCDEIVGQEGGEYGAENWLDCFRFATEGDSDSIA